MDLFSTDLSRILSRPWASSSPSLSTAELAPSVSLAPSRIPAPRPSSLCSSSAGPPSTISLHPTLIYPSTCLPRCCTPPSPPSGNPAHDRAYTRTIFPTPTTFRLPPLLSHASSLFIPRFHGETERSARDEQQRGPTVLVKLSESSSRVHVAPRNISIASRALTRLVSSPGSSLCSRSSSSATLDDDDETVSRKIDANNYRVATRLFRSPTLLPTLLFLLPRLLPLLLVPYLFLFHRVLPRFLILSD